MILEYRSSVFTAAGWRSVTIRAQCLQVSPGFATVDSVQSIDGESPRYGMSRTGAKRQEYNGVAIASREKGIRKRISACAVIEGGAK